MRRLLVSRLPGETRSALLDGDHLIDMRIDRDRRPSLVGGIYRGRVTAVSTAGAFVSINRGPDGFLPLRKDDRITEGQSLIVTVTRDAEGAKGPKLNREPRLEGRFMVLLPLGKNAKVSRSLTDKARRDALIDWAASKTMGLIVRRTAAGAPGDLLDQEYNALTKVWEKAENKRDGAPCRLVPSPDGLAELLTQAGHLDEIIADEAEILGRLRDFCTERAPDLAVRIVPHGEAEPLFETFDLEERLEALQEPVVALPSGGRLIIEATAALTAMDVDTGATPARGKGGAPHQANLEAATAIPEQIRLRNIGGAIAVDFAGDSKSNRRRELEDRLREGLDTDPVPCHVTGWGPNGWLELIRERRRPSVDEIMLAPGSRQPNTETLAFQILRRLLAESRQAPRGTLVLRLHSSMVACLEGQHREALDQTRRRLGCPLRLTPDDRLAVDQINLGPDNDQE
ncbi:ribonuclease E/G [Magnetospira sp. QH-2]|uniref:ribonuclease E/G n=1 Tax=Magnetospira sp. (strain QH-2) TaxID=1288970 RepID=UPI0003E814C9|nr:ribonuclease E/G [Magnetospira sp. QH-2]CCQ74348.1 putative Ribonuclease G (rng, cafA) [Magnetospira sp. QH-2]